VTPSPRKWSERPLACIVFKPSQTADTASLAAHLTGAGFAKWQLPDRYEIVDAIPRTSTGKFWKIALRRRFVA
jgi:fatty-acyl-CoA synthase